jgi:hypothetical protein
MEALHHLGTEARHEQPDPGHFPPPSWGGSTECPLANLRGHGPPSGILRGHVRANAAPGFFGNGVDPFHPGLVACAGLRAGPHGVDPGAVCHQRGCRADAVHGAAAIRNPKPALCPSESRLLLHQQQQRRLQRAVVGDLGRQLQQGPLPQPQKGPAILRGFQQHPDAREPDPQRQGDPAG